MSKAMTSLRGRLLIIGLLVCLGIDAKAIVLDIAGNVSLAITTVNSIGHGLADDTDTTTYSVVNALGTKNLVGRLNTTMPAHVSLRVQVAAPSGATSAGPVAMTASNQTLVTGIGIVAQSGLPITVTLGATVQAGVISAGSRTLTLTLVDAP